MTDASSASDPETVLGPVPAPHPGAVHPGTTPEEALALAMHHGIIELTERADRIAELELRLEAVSAAHLEADPALNELVGLLAFIDDAAQDMVSYTGLQNKGRAKRKAQLIRESTTSIRAAAERMLPPHILESIDIAASDEDDGPGITSDG